MSAKLNFVTSIGLLSTIFALASCEQQQQDFVDESDSTEFIQVKPVPSYLQKGMPALKEKEMLTVADPMTPGEWLLSRYQKNEGHDPARDMKYYNIQLNHIISHVHEDRRVVANRIVQVTNQLNEKGFASDQDSILSGFADAFQSHTNDHYVFGEIIANYSNLRQQGMNHQDAIAKLFSLLERE